MRFPVRFLLLMALPLAAGLAVAAQAQTQGFDTNRDGKISRAEFVAGRSARFAQLDKNRDGVVNGLDFPRAMNRPRGAERIERLIAGADANGDGNITRAELSKAGTPAFDRADANRDGFVDRAEAESLKASLADRR